MFLLGTSSSRTRHTYEYRRVGYVRQRHSDSSIRPSRLCLEDGCRNHCDVTWRSGYKSYSMYCRERELISKSSNTPLTCWWLTHAQMNVMLQGVLVRDDTRALTAACTTGTNLFAALWAATRPALQVRATVFGTGITFTVAMKQLMMMDMKSNARYLEKLPFIELQLLRLNGAAAMPG